MAAYARRAGITEIEFRARMGEPLTPILVGAGVRVLTDPDPSNQRAFTLAAEGCTRSTETRSSAA